MNSKTDQKTVTASALIIGNEILSGRTQDKNTQYIAEALGRVGIQLREARVVPDVLDEIVEALNTLRSKYDYVFTSGGIGPTHDDITVDCVSAAFGVPVVQHVEAYKRLLSHYGEADLTDARLKMAKGPEGAGYIDNPVSAAPGFIIDNVYVMAGVPKIMQAMLDSVLPSLKGGVKVRSQTIRCFVPESKTAVALAGVQNNFETVDIGSYPYFRNGEVGVSVVLRSADESQLDDAVKAVISALDEVGARPKLVDE